MCYIARRGNPDGGLIAFCTPRAQPLSFFASSLYACKLAVGTPTCPHEQFLRVKSRWTVVLVYFGLSAWPCAAGGCLVARLPDGFEFPHLERASEPTWSGNMCARSRNLTRPRLPLSCLCVTPDFFPGGLSKNDSNHLQSLKTERDENRVKMTPICPSLAFCLRGNAERRESVNVPRFF